MTLPQVAKAIFPHPTQTDLFGELARRTTKNQRSATLTKGAVFRPLLFLSVCRKQPPELD
jgi:hypothetical protein